MLEELPVALRVACAGVAIGGAFGFVVRRSDFCMMGAVADVAISGDSRRLRAWVLAIAVALLVTQALHGAGLIDLASTRYLGSTVSFPAIALGGLMFGVGMVLSCGCPSRSAVNAACGDLRAMFTLLGIAVFAGMTMRGLLAWPRLWLTVPTSVETGSTTWLPGADAVSLVTAMGDIPDGVARGALTLGVAAALVGWCLADARFRSTARLWLAGLAIGLLVAFAWWATGLAGADDFEPAPLASLTFVRPAADSLLYLMTFTGASVDFGIASFGGVMAGALLAALTSRTRPSLRGFEDAGEMARYLTGGALMGVGGVLALGCTVGQGIAGAATLGLGSLLALLAILAGGLLGARYLQAGTLRGTLGFGGLSD